MGISLGPTSSSTSSYVSLNGGDNSNLLYGRGAITEAGGVTVQGNGVFNSGLQVGKNNSGHITVNDTSALAGLAAQNSGILGGALQSVSTGASSLLNNALGKISDLSESSQTGGASQQNKIILYLVLGIAAAVVMVFYFRRRS